MGTRKMRERQPDLWYGGELPTAPGHPFYKRLNEVLDSAKFDPFCEAKCASFYHNKLGRPSLPPGQYFRVMMIGFFEGIDSERGIAWRLADSLTLRQFLSIGLDEKTPDHVTISRTRRLLMVRPIRKSSAGCSSVWLSPGSSRERPLGWIRPLWKPMRR